MKKRNNTLYNELDYPFWSKIANLYDEINEHNRQGNLLEDLLWEKLWLITSHFQHWLNEDLEIITHN